MRRDRRLEPLRQVGRRRFLQYGLAGLCSFLGVPLAGGCKKGGDGGGSAVGAGIANMGPLQPADANGVRLPPGYSSRIVARSGQAPVAGAPAWHGAPDGGATFATPDGGWIYVSNSELASGAGGVGALRFDAAGNVVDAYAIAGGTSRNCAGGRTPSGTWLTCEENGDVGQVFECDPTGASAAVARPALGRFNHEAVAVDSVLNRLYLTEDRTDGGFYRFTPAGLTPQGYPDLSAGTLEIAQVAGGGPEGAVAWLLVPDPDGSPTLTRYQAALTPFNGGEGIGYHAGSVYFATKGDNRIWSYDVASQTLVIIYDDSTSLTPILTGVDNIEISADGDILVAEDGGDMQIVAITPSGGVVAVSQLVGHNASEITGPAFDPGHTRLYFSSQRGTTGSSSDGMTFEITGPFVV